MNRHSVYFTNPKTGTVHLADFDTVALPSSTTFTYCGRSTADLEDGDETLSGIAATCQTCRRLQVRAISG